MADLSLDNLRITETRILKDITYCGICSMPPEYCEFGSKLTKCKPWLKEKDAKLFAKLYGESGMMKR